MVCYVLQMIMFTVTEECCWDLVDSSTEKLLQVPPIHSLEQSAIVAPPAPPPQQQLQTQSMGTVPPQTLLNRDDHVEVIPMQEELEVRLEEGNFPVPNNWSYDVKMDPDMVAAALASTTTDNEPNPTANDSQQHQQPSKSTNYQEYSGGNQVKLELEVTLTPEINTTISSDNLITSTVSSNSNLSSTTQTAVNKTVTTVIPPTTIVCLPSMVLNNSNNNTNNTVTQCAAAAAIPRPGMMQSSSAVPYLALSTSQPIRAVPQHTTKTKPKTNQGNTSNRNRNNNKPPPGAVNLERSYQICQAVIQNSPNRDQLRCQLKPPPSLLAAQQAAASNNNKKDNNKTQYSSVTSSRTTNKTFTPPLPAPPPTANNYQMVQGGNGMKNIGQKMRSIPYPQQQRQPSPPVVVRHVFTSGQGIPVTMAVLPQASALSPEVSEYLWLIFECNLVFVGKLHIYRNKITNMLGCRQPAIYK